MAAAMDATLLVLQVSGKGIHKLEMEVRLKLAHVGGWRGTTGSLPMAPAATVTFPCRTAADRGSPGPGHRPPHA